MAGRGSVPAISEADYDAIEEAVMETARGRWFLGEFARRNRTADTQVLLDAIGRLEQAVVGERHAQDMDRLRFDLMEMAKAISLTKTEIAAIRPADHAHSHLVAASEALDAIARTTERATQDILDAAEHIQEAAWTMREGGSDASLCDELDRRATDIYTACSFQDLTAQRTARIVQTLRYLEGRINAMIDIWGGTHKDADASAPSAAGSEAKGPPAGLSQTDIDGVIVGEDFFGWPAPRPEMEPALAAPTRPECAAPIEDDLVFMAVPKDRLLEPDPAAPSFADNPRALPPIRAEAFAEIDGLELREKVKQFT